MKHGWAEKYLMEKPGVTKDFKEEWCWTRCLPDDKMLTAVCQDDTGKEFLITVKLNPVGGDFSRQQYEDITPGYYMNKEYWNSAKIKGFAPDEVLEDMLDKSYHLILGGLSEKKQKELLREAQMGR